jgi:hypothetical protein
MVFSQKHGRLLPKPDAAWVLCKTRTGFRREKPTKKSWGLLKKNRLNFRPLNGDSSLSRTPGGFFCALQGRNRAEFPRTPSGIRIKTEQLPLPQHMSAPCRPDSYGGAGEPAPISGFFRQKKPPGVRMRHETPWSGRKLRWFFLSSPHDFLGVFSGLLRCFGQITTSSCLEFGSWTPLVPSLSKCSDPDSGEGPEAKPDPTFW